MEDVQRLFHVHGRLHGKGECVRSCGSLRPLAEQRPLITLTMQHGPKEDVQQQQQQGQGKAKAKAKRIRIAVCTMASQMRSGSENMEEQQKQQQQRQQQQMTLSSPRTPKVNMCAGTHGVHGEWPLAEQRPLAMVMPSLLVAMVMARTFSSILTIVKPSMLQAIMTMVPANLKNFLNDDVQH